MNRRFLLATSLVALLAAVPAMAQKKAAQPSSPIASDKEQAAPTPKNDASSADLAAIRATSDAFTAAFDAGDAKAVALLWTSNGEYIDESGETFSGREAIEKLYADYFAKNPSRRIRVIIDSLQVLPDGTALEKGRTVLEPAPAGAPAIGRYTAEHVQVNGKWLMSKVRDARVETPSAYRGIADLDFLIGTWVAEEYGIKTESVCRWVANKSFVERKYTVTDVDGTTISGVQLIGWNPKTGAVQSWDFSPGGGHATGTWSPIAGGWSAEVNGVTGDGVSTAAVNVLKRLDDDAYVWRSVNRSAGGELLPDTDEVVMKRSKASH